MNDGRQISCNDRSAHLLLLRFEPHLKCFECTKQSKTEIHFSSPTTSLIASSSRFLEQQLSPLLRCKHHPASWLVSEKPLKRRSFALSCTVAQTHEEEESAFGLNGATCVTSSLCRSEERTVVVPTTTVSSRLIKPHAHELDGSRGNLLMSLPRCIWTIAANLIQK
jgi:hypothetical protein